MRTGPRHAFALAAPLALAAVACAGAAAPAPSAGFAMPAPDGSLFFDEARYFDGKRFLSGDILVSDGRIQAVDVLPVPLGATVVACEGRTLLPGLIDAHVHAGDDRANLALALVFGVTLEVDLFGPPSLLVELRKLEGSRETAGLADLRGAGNLATAPGGHGTEYGVPIPTLVRPDEAAAWVDARIAEGSDLIKISYDRRDDARLSRETLAALVAAAHARGKQAWVHIGVYEDAVEAVAAGADVLAHVWFDRLPDADFVAELARRRVAVVPTLTARTRRCGLVPGRDLAADPAIRPFLRPAELKRLASDFFTDAAPCLDTIFGTVRALHDAGVRLLAGTDAINAGTAHGASLHGELALLVRAGLSPAEALAAATSAPADQLGLGDRGRIEVGARADLVLVEGDAGADVTATRHIVSVWKRGVPAARIPLTAP